MELAIQNTPNRVTVSETNFAREFNEPLVHQVVVAYMAEARQGTRAQKTRGEVSGSTRKPWRQKGSGRARAGSIRSPIWRSGGVTFAAKPQNYGQKINRKMYRGALRSILSELVRKDRLIIVQDFTVESPKTRLMVQKLKEMSLQKVLIVTTEVDENLFLAARNLIGVNVVDASAVDPVSLITFEKVVMTVGAVEKVEEMLE